MAEGDGRKPTSKKRCPAEQEMYESVWKSVRDADESKYSFSSMQLKRKRPLREQKGKIKQEMKKSGMPTTEHKSVSLFDISPGVIEPEMLESASYSYSQQDSGSSICIGSSIACGNSALSNLEIYIRELRNCQAVSPCDSTLKTFVIQDWNESTLSLKPRKFIFVKRTAKVFTDGIEWVYSCSCNIHNANLLDGMGHNPGIEYSVLQSIVPDCIHIDTMRNIVVEVDAIHDIHPQLEFSDHTYAGVEVDPKWEVLDKVAVLQNGEYICVSLDNSTGVLYCEKGVIKCATCYDKTACSHVTYMNEVIDDLDSSSPAEVLLRTFVESLNRTISASPSCKSLLCQSTNKIPFSLSETQKAIFNESDTERYNISDEDHNAHLIPELDMIRHCSLCNGCSWSPQYTLERKSNIITYNKIISARVYCYTCSEELCKGKIVFDGNSKCLLNMGQFFVAHEVLRLFMHHFLNGKTTMFTEYTVLKKIQEDSGSHFFSSLFTYNHFRFSWYNYLSLLDIDYGDGFKCTICGDQPETVIMDATSLAFRREADSWHEALFQQQQVSEKKSGSRFRDRILIPDKQTRECLKSFVKNDTNNIVSLKLLILKNAPCMMKLLEFVAVHGRLTSEWREFVLALSTSSPVCALFHPSDKLFSLLHKIAEFGPPTDLKDMQFLQSECPVLFNVFRHNKNLPKTILSDLLFEIIAKAKAPFVASTEEYHLPTSVHAPNDDIAFFPSLPVVRLRGSYHSDNTKRDKICTKHTIGHPSLLPGVFILFCKHGICYGFEVMRVCESPNTAFTTLFTRFRKGPNNIIYDNACNLHNYSLNREPDFFKTTWFLVDRFHWKNHAGCSVGYNMSLYPQFTEINSQIVEQCNSVLKRTKSSLSYMTKKNFLDHCKFMLWYRNTMQKP